MSLDATVERLLAEGFEVAQAGRIVPAADPRASFADRAEGFRLGPLGVFCEGNGWRSEFENRLFDDDERWAHLRRRRS